jgi:hypothetical protein
MKILVALFAFIALSVSAFAVPAAPLTLTVAVQHEQFTCSVAGVADFGSFTYGDGIVTTHTFNIVTTITTDATPLTYVWALTAANVVPDGGWSGAAILTTATYDVSFKTPTYRKVGEDLSASLACEVNYIR